MKKLLIIMLLASSINVSAQPLSTEIAPLKSDYLKLSRNQKTAAWIMLGGGALLCTGGIFIALNNVYLYTWYDNTPTTEEKAAPVMVLLGSVSMLGSIPLFIASARNKGRSMGASAQLKMETVQNIRHQSFVKSSYPALSLKFSLR